MTDLRTIILSGAAAMAVSSALGSSAANPRPDIVTSAPAPFDYTVDRFADIEVLRYQVPGFESLTQRQKILIY